MTKDAGQQAIKKFSGHMIDNRSLRVNESNEKPQRNSSRF